jgi:hypothetical protein
VNIVCVKKCVEYGECNEKDIPHSCIHGLNSKYFLLVGVVVAVAADDAAAVVDDVEPMH